MPIYSYAELKGKIKVGDRVRAVIGRPNVCSEFGRVADIVKDNSKVCSITNVGESGFHMNGCYHRYDKDYFLELLTEEKTLDWVDVGDVVVDRNDIERTILDKSPNGTVLFLSSVDSTDWAGAITTRQQLKYGGFTVKQSTPVPEPKEMTLDEISKALGYPVRIKE